MTTPQHRADLFIDPVDDPREGGPRLGGERATLTEFLRGQRLTLELKCQDLDADQMARRSVYPSTMSLLGLVRHMADVERKWFRMRFGGKDVGLRYQRPEDPDGDWNGALADPALVAEPARRGRRRRGAVGDLGHRRGRRVSERARGEAVTGAAAGRGTATVLPTRAWRNWQTRRV